MKATTKYVIEYIGKEGDTIETTYVGHENWKNAVAAYWILFKSGATPTARFFVGDIVTPYKIGDWIEVESQMLEGTLLGKYVNKMPKTARRINDFQRLENGITYDYRQGQTFRGGTTRNYVTRKKAEYQEIEPLLY